MEQFVFEVPGRPQGKGRPRASAVHGHARMRTPAETVQYENWIRLCYQQRYEAQRFAPPVVLEINAYFEKDFRHAHRSVIGRISQEKERIQASRNIELENKIAVSEEKEDDSTKSRK